MGATDASVGTGADAAWAGARCEGADDPDKSRTFIVREYDFAIPEDGKSLGVDIDGVDGTDAKTGIGCGKDDLVSPDGQKGIDNGMGPIWGMFLQILGEAMAQGLQQAAVHDGRTIMLLRLEGVDDEENDDCTDIRTLTGAGQPLIGSDGEILPGQTFAVDDMRSASFGRGWIRDGRVHAEADELTLEANLGRYTFVNTFHTATVEFDLDLDGIHAMLAGGLDADAAVEAALKEAEFGEAQSLAPAIPGIIHGAADLAPDADGTCTQVSTVVIFDAVPVFIEADAPRVDDP